jgi:hypothetical protein
MRTAEILPQTSLPVSKSIRFSESIKEKKEEMKVLDFDKVCLDNYPTKKVVIDPDARFLVCAFMRPDWTGTGEKHAAFINVDLDTKSMIAYDSLRWGMEDCITAMQMYIHQYAMRNSLPRYFSGEGVPCIPQWTIYDISKQSLKQHNGIDCTMWSVWMMFCHYLEIPPTVFLTPEYDIKHCRGAAWGWSGCGCINNDVSSMKNAASYGSQHTFMDRWRLIVAYLLSHLEGGEDGLGAPSIHKIVAAFKAASIASTTVDSKDSNLPVSYKFLFIYHGIIMT